MSAIHGDKLGKVQMRHRPVIVGLLLILVGVQAAPLRAQQKPFTQEQVQGLVRDGLGDDSGAAVISKRGIDFTPTEDFLQRLKAAGASDAFLQALRAAKPPEEQASNAQKPLTEVQVISLVAGGDVPAHRIAILVEDRGIDFEPDAEFLTQLRSAGADDELEGALRNAKVVKPVKVDVADKQRQDQIKQHTSRAAQDLQNRQYAQAESEYRAALELDPQNADLHLSLGIALGDQGNWDGQIAEEREAIRINPNNDRAHVALGAGLSRHDDKATQDAAIAEYREAIRINPNNDLAHMNLGNRLWHENDWDGAEAEYRTAARLNPKSDQPLTSLAAVLEHKKDLDGAIAEYRAALQLNSKNVSTHENLASALSRKGDLDGAIAEYRTAAQLKPTDDQVHVSLGVVLSQKNDQDGAIAEYREAIRINPRNEYAHVNLGNRLWHKKDWDGAIEEYRQALGINANNAVAHYGLGTAYEQKGDRQSAAQEYRAAAAIDPKNQTYQKAYNRLNTAGYQ